MAGVERSQNNEGVSVEETLALFLSGKIKRDDLNENDRAVLGFYIGLMDEDPAFAGRVNSRKDELVDNFKKNQFVDTVGRKTPLYSLEEIKKLSKHKKRKKAKEEYLPQLQFWQKEPTPDTGNENGIIFGLENIIDPERKTFEVGKSLDHPIYYHGKDSIIKEEIKEKNTKLRNQIGLPVARGKDPHVNDKFYKFLVKRVCTIDTFGIFTENDRVQDQVPDELNSKINEVQGLIDELLNKNLDRKQRFNRFNQFVQEYNDRWIPPDSNENG